MAVQVYVAVRSNRRVWLPADLCEALQVNPGEWLRLTALADRRAVLERVPADIPRAVLERGAAAIAFDNHAEDHKTGYWRRRAAGEPAGEQAD